MDRVLLDDRPVKLTIWCSVSCTKIIVKREATCLFQGIEFLCSAA